MTEQHPGRDSADEVVGSVGPEAAEQDPEPTADGPGASAPGRGGAARGGGSGDALAHDVLERDLQDADVRGTAARHPQVSQPESAGERSADERSADETQGGSEQGPQGRHPDTVLAAERLGDLQRLQAEYVNYKRRVDRDRAVVQERAVQSVIEALLPVLDDIHAAREHGDLVDGPFAAIADKLESTLTKFGLERYGAAGEEFDPALHEALMHTAWPADGSLIAEGGATTVVQVLQPGYRAGDQVLRAARVAVADPE